jgi:hypothetical protein
MSRPIRPSTSPSGRPSSGTGSSNRAASVSGSADEETEPSPRRVDSR